MSSPMMNSMLGFLPPLPLSPFLSSLSSPPRAATSGPAGASPATAGRAPTTLSFNEPSAPDAAAQPSSAQVTPTSSVCTFVFLNICPLLCVDKGWPRHRPLGRKPLLGACSFRPFFPRQHGPFLDQQGRGRLADGATGYWPSRESASRSGALGTRTIPANGLSSSRIRKIAPETD